MFQNMEVMRMAHALAVHAGTRQAIVARNIAHANTPGYKALQVAPFAEIYGTRRTGLPEDRDISEADTVGSPNGNTVSLEAEMMTAATVRHDHDMALSIYRSALTILRASLGRR